METAERTGGLAIDEVGLNSRWITGEELYISRLAEDGWIGYLKQDFSHKESTPDEELNLRRLRIWALLDRL